MRVCVAVRSLSQLDCFTFSPSANFMPAGALDEHVVGMGGPPAEFHDRVLPAGLADPCNWFAAVSPPAIWR